MNSTLSQSVVGDSTGSGGYNALSPGMNRLHYSNSLVDLSRETLDPSLSDRPRVSSILKTKARLAESDGALRKDSSGVKILNGSKQHHICFKEKIKEEKEVESYKKYNQQVPGSECIGCAIF